MTQAARAIHSPRWRYIVQGVAWGAATGTCIAFIDVVDSELTGFGGSLGYLGWYTWSALVFAFGLLGGALGAWTLAVFRLTRGASGRWGAWARAFWLGLPAGAFMAWVPTSWLSEHWPSSNARGQGITAAVYIVAIVASTLTAWIALWLTRRYRSARPKLPLLHPALLALSALIAAFAYWADRRVLVELYEDFHYGLAGACVAAFALLLMLLRVTLEVRLPKVVRATRALGDGRLVSATLAAAFGSLLLLEQLAPAVFGPSSSVMFSKLTSTVRTWSDVDGDGTSNLFGGSDCAAFDPSAEPGQFDLPGNDVDEDCSGTPAEWPKPEPEPTYAVPDLSGYNLLLISIDALRADHVGAYGYTEHPTTPNIDRLAERSVAFTEAYSPAPKTYDALPCLATGLYPSNVPRDYRVKRGKGEKRRPYLYRVTNDVKLLSEVMQARGYVTGAAHVSILKSLGLNRGFDEYQLTRRPSEMAIDFLQRRVVAPEKAQPFFLWLHYYSPHSSYASHPGFEFGERDVDRYDSEIAYDDQQIGQLLAELERLELTERTLVILTADHGEEFRDHGGTEHGLRLYRELTRVPLLLSIPGFPQNRVSVPVELADVAPTVCQLLRLRCGTHDGHSLMAAVAGKRHPDRGAYSELYRQGDRLLKNALTTNQWRLIYDYKKDRAELYDRTSDVTEQHDVARKHRELVQELRDRMATRTLYRQGQVFQRYQQSNDSLVLAQSLPVFRRNEMLALALDRIGVDAGPRHLPYLKQLQKRPQLQPKLKKLTQRLILRIENPPPKRADNDTHQLAAPH